MKAHEDISENVGKNISQILKILKRYRLSPVSISTRKQFRVREYWQDAMLISVTDSDTSRWRQAMREIYCTFPSPLQQRLCIEIENPSGACRRTSTTTTIRHHHAIAFKSIMSDLESLILSWLNRDALGFGFFYRKSNLESEVPTVIVHVKENAEAD